LWWRRPGTFSDPEPRWMSPDHCRLDSHFITSAASLSPSLRLHPAHFNLIFLPHVPRPSGDESVQLLPCLMLVSKLGTFPKDQNHTYKGERSQNYQSPT
jgi:hypothetical protein